MSNPEVEIIDCAECGEPIEVNWADGPGEFLPVLIADWVFHPQCWEKIAARYPGCQRTHISSPYCWCEPEEDKEEKGVYIHKQVQ